MYKATLTDKNDVKAIISARSISKLMRKIENCVRTQMIILDEGERLFFPKDQKEITVKGRYIEITHRFLVMDLQNVCYPGRYATTWELEEEE